MIALKRLKLLIRLCTCAGLPPLHSNAPLIERIVQPKPALLMMQLWAG
jgi:hypothetical protein